MRGCLGSCTELSRPVSDTPSSCALERPSTASPRPSWRLWSRVSDTSRRRRRKPCDTRSNPTFLWTPFLNPWSISMDSGPLVKRSTRSATSTRSSRRRSSSERTKPCCPSRSASASFRFEPSTIARRNLAGFRRVGRLRSGDFRPNHLEDVPGPAVPRPAEAADRPHLVDVDESVREDPIIDVEPERFSEEHSVVRHAHGAQEAALEVHRGLRDARWPHHLRWRPRKARLVELAHLRGKVARGQVHLLRDLLGDEIHDELPCVEDIAGRVLRQCFAVPDGDPEDHRMAGDAHAVGERGAIVRSEEHTSELQSHHDLVCRLLLE